VDKWSAIIYGEAASKDNSRQLVTIKGRPALIKSVKARLFERAAHLQLQVAELKKPISGPVSATLRIYYTTERPDLDESVVLDVLQGYAYLNDRQVREKHVFHGIDKVRPRVEIEVVPLVR